MSRRGARESRLPARDILIEAYMIIPIKLASGATLPETAHASDTGYDLSALSDPLIVGEKDGGAWRRIDYIEYDTGVSVAPPVKCFDALHSEYAYLEVFPRSSISKTNLVLANSIGLIDNAYRGTIKLRFKYLWQPEDLRQFTGEEWSRQFLTVVNQERIYHKGDKIGQLVARTKQAIKWAVVESLPETVRSDGGFGSTDRRMHGPAKAFTMSDEPISVHPDFEILWRRSLAKESAENERCVRGAPRPQDSADTPFNPLDHEQTK
jgi:dUTP diphosphatase